MYILDHHPIAYFTSVLESIDGEFFLALTHRNIDKRTFYNSFVIQFANFLNFRRWINSWEQNKEHGGLNIGFRERRLDIKRGLFNVFQAHIVYNVCS